jgi:zinc and cadmium transporter
MTCARSPLAHGGRGPAPDGVRTIQLEGPVGLLVLFSLLGSVGATSVSALLLLFPVAVRRRLVPALVSFATGSLLAAALLAMLPEALELAPARTVTGTLLAGLLLFFVLEKVVLWRHCHVPGCDTHAGAGPLLLVGDAVHNFADGLVIGAGFVVSPGLGVTAALAAIAHEVPQEVGDFAVLLDAGFSRARAFLWNTAAALTTLPGALLAWAGLADARGLVPHVLALSAASFLYVATADLIPGLHRRPGAGAAGLQLALMAAGVATIALLGHHH